MGIVPILLSHTLENCSFYDLDVVANAHVLDMFMFLVQQLTLFIQLVLDKFTRLHDLDDTKANSVHPTGFKSKM